MTFMTNMRGVVTSTSSATRLMAAVTDMRGVSCKYIPAVHDAHQHNHCPNGYQLISCYISVLVFEEIRNLLCKFRKLRFLTHTFFLTLKSLPVYGCAGSIMPLCCMTTRLCYICTVSIGNSINKCTTEGCAGIPGIYIGSLSGHLVTGPSS